MACSTTSCTQVESGVDLGSTLTGEANRIPKKKQDKRPPVTQTAKVHTLAEADKSTSSKSHVSDAIFDKIKKCLEKAKHPNTPELETKAAFKLANRLMSQYNVTHADVQSRAADNDEDTSSAAGQSTVRITTNKWRAVNQSFVASVAHAMMTFFDCKYYYSDCYRYFEYTFYGIAANTVVAAMAFETAHNIILEWGRSKAEIDRLDGPLENETLCSEHPGDKETPETIGSPGAAAESHSSDDNGETSAFDDPGYNSEGSDEGADDTSLGIQPTFKQEDENTLAWDIDVDEELQRMVQQATKNEEANIKLEEEEDDDDEGQGGGGVNSFPEVVQKEEETAEPQTENLSLWKTHAQLVLFRKSAMQVAEDYIGDKKIRNSKKRFNIKIDPGIYNQGWRDSKQIDFKRRRLE